jgi:hypothetical protein
VAVGFTNGVASVDIPPQAIAVFGSMPGFSYTYGAPTPAPPYDANLDVTVNAIVGNSSSATGGTLRAAFDSAWAPARVRGKASPSAVVTTFQSGHGFTFGNNDATSNLNDTTNYSLGSQCVTMVTKGTGAITTLGNGATTPVNLTGSNLRIRLRGQNLAHISRLGVYAGTGGLANIYNFDFIYKAEVVQSVNYSKDGEWVDLDLSFADATTSGTPDRTNISAWQLRVTDDNTGNKVTVNFQGIYVVPKSSTYPNGVLSWTWDDSVLSPLQLAKPTLDANGWLSTYYCILDVFGTTDGGGVQYMTLAQAQELYRQGNDVAPHCTTLARHSSTNGMIDLTPAQLVQEFQDLKAWAHLNGFGRSADHFATPQGKYTPAMIDTMRTYFASHRTVSWFTHETVRPSDVMRLRSVSLPGAGSSSTVASVNTAIDKAVAEGAWLIIYGHQMTTGTSNGPLQCTQSDFQAIASHAASAGIPVRTVSQVLNDMG